MPDSNPVARQLAAVRARIDRATADAGRPADSVSLVAVSKTKPAESIADAYDAGQRIFGENRVQEAAAKFPDLRASRPDIRLHLLGPLQTNKVRQACALFDVIETVDREKLARALAAELEMRDRDDGAAKPDMLIQVNVGREPQKAGIAPDQAGGFIDLCRDQLKLPVRGLMCIPPLDEEPSPYFALLAELARRHALPWLSMGMSGDFEIAIQQGATHVRVGTAIFGER